MLNIPALPTDNIYKFTTFLGLAIIIISFGGFIFNYDTFKNNYLLRIKYYEDYKLYKQRINEANILDILCSEESYKNRIFKVDSLYDKKYIDTSNYWTISRVKYIDTSTTLLKNRLGKKLDELEKTYQVGIDVKKEIQKHSSLRTDLILTSFPYMMFGLFGFVVFRIGFRSWRTRLQAIQDKQLKETVEKA